VEQAAGAIATRLRSRLNGALLIHTEGAACAGIVTCKDLLFQVVSRGLPAASTSVASVMTPNPDSMPSTATALQALHQLQCGGYRNLPVLSPSGAPLGVLDVLTLVEGTLFREGGPLAVHSIHSPKQESKLWREVVVKLVCPQVTTRKGELVLLGSAPDSYADLHAAALSALSLSKQPLLLSYVDADQDRIVLTGDAAWRQVVAACLRTADHKLVLHVSLAPKSSFRTVVGVGMLLAGVGLLVAASRRVKR